MASWLHELLSGVFGLPLAVLRRVHGFLGLGLEGRGAVSGAGSADRVGAGQADISGGPQASC